MFRHGLFDSTPLLAVVFSFLGDFRLFSGLLLRAPRRLGRKQIGAGPDCKSLTSVCAA